MAFGSPHGAHGAVHVGGEAVDSPGHRGARSLGVHLQLTHLEPVELVTVVLCSWDVLLPLEVEPCFLLLIDWGRERDLLQVPHFFVGTLQPL